MSTYGTGLQLKAALKTGCKTLYLGLGGSGTHDAGCGIAAALGIRFFHQGKAFLPTGATLNQIDAIDDSESLFNQYPAQLVCLCDVTNPLFGPLSSTGLCTAERG